MVRAVVLLLLVTLPLYVDAPFRHSELVSCEISWHMRTTVDFPCMLAGLTDWNLTSLNIRGPSGWGKETAVAELRSEQQPLPSS